MRRIRGLRRPSGAGRADVRPGARPALALPALLTLALALAGCADEPTTPRAGGEEPGGRTPPRMLGLVEITISGLGTAEVTSSALGAPTVEALERVRAERAAGGTAGRAAPGGLAPQDFTLPDDSTGDRDGTIQLEPLSTGSFTDGVRGSGGVRYLYATYRVRNAPDGGGAGYNTERRNLTFYAVDTDGTIDQTAVSVLELFNGDAADPALAAQLIPTGAAAKDPGTNTIESVEPDVLQVLTEAEADAIQALADPAGVTDVFPYGFVVQNAGDPTSRTLPANPAPGQFDGVVTFAFKVPLQADPAADPFTVTAVFLAVDDDEVKLTQSLDEQALAGRLAFGERAASLGASLVTLLPGGVYGGTIPSRRICRVRAAGPAVDPTGYLVNVSPATWSGLSPDPYAAGSIAQNAQIAASFDAVVVGASAETFVVHGMQSGRQFLGASYAGNGTSTVTAPAAGFFPGEEVEVVLTPGLG
ncbi:MAG TPA: hypothetical protein VF188_12745, partial [Longimicrobiales bacterium]